MFVNTNVFAVVNTGVITGVLYIVMAFVLFVAFADFCGVLVGFL